MIGYVLIGIVAGFSLSLLKEKFMNKKNNGNVALERIRTLYLQLEALQNERAEYVSSQNKRIKKTQDALVKIIHADPNQTEIELNSEDN